jgi:hypothetical protein
VPVPAILIAVGGALSVIGSFVTWFTIDGTSFTGFGSSSTDDTVKDGPVFLTMGIVLIVLAVILFVMKKVLGVAITAIVFAGLTAIFALADLGDVDDVKSVARAFDSEFTTGPGLYLCLVGALVALGGSIWATAVRRR